MTFIRSALVAVFVFACLLPVDAQGTKKKPAAKKVNPVFAPPEEDPTLPYVLLIGDSISIGYTLNVRQELKGVANVYRPPTNCGPTTKGIAEISQWLGDRKWDVIHFNHGLHDLKYMGPKGQNLADPNDAASHQQVPIDQYQANMEELARQIKQSAKIAIWRETTPVPDGAAGRVVGDSKKYNDAAAKAMENVGGIQTDPFFDFAESIKEHQRPANVHYTPEGSKQLGKHVAEVIRSALEQR